MKYLLGLDIGTTNIKALAIDLDGRLRAYASRPTPVLHPQPGWSEFAPEEIWRTTCACIQQVCREIDASQIVSVGVSSMAETAMPMDDAGRPLYNFIAWYDFRAESQTKAIISQMGKRQIYEITGQTASPKYGLPKMMWFRDTHPERFQRTRVWLGMEDYIIYRLCGRQITDYSVASRTMAFDIGKLAWSEEMLRAAGLSEDLFPRAVPGGTAVGHVSRDAALQTGMAASACVVMGGHDHACAAVTVGITEEDVVLDSMGTAEVSMAAMKAPALTEETFHRCYTFYPHFGKNLYRVLTSNQCCGASIEWYLNTLGRDILMASGDGRANKYDEMYSRIDFETARHSDLFFLPFLRGTVEQSGACGTFWGMRDIHRQGDFIVALLEGMCFELKRKIQGYRELFGGAFDKLRVVGGLSQSEPLMQMKANIQGRSIAVPENREAAGTGAALLGGLGAGILTESGMPLRLESSRIYRNDPGFSDRYADIYRRYIEVRQNVLAVYMALAEEGSCDK